MCPNAMFCSTDTCCFDYQSNDKAGHSGKWHKLCERLFTVFLFQKLDTDIAVVYRKKKKKKKCITLLEKNVKVKNSLKLSFLRISSH